MYIIRIKEKTAKEHKKIVLWKGYEAENQQKESNAYLQLFLGMYVI